MPLRCNCILQSPSIRCILQGSACGVRKHVTALVLAELFFSAALKSWRCLGTEQQQNSASSLPFLFVSLLLFVLSQDEGAIPHSSAIAGCDLPPQRCENILPNSTMRLFDRHLVAHRSRQWVENCGMAQQSEHVWAAEVAVGCCCSVSHPAEYSSMGQGWERAIES